MILQRASVQSLRYSAIITNPVSFDPNTGSLFINYTNSGVYYIVDILNPSDSPFILAANQVHLCNNLQINADYNIIGSIFTEATDIYGTGSLFGTGDVL